MRPVETASTPVEIVKASQAWRVDFNDAKDIIDVQIIRPPGVNGPDEDWAKFLFTPVPGRRAANVHVRVTGKPNQRYALLFRDYLRMHPPMAAAEEWAAQVNWHPGPSDA